MVVFQKSLMLNPHELSFTLKYNSSFFVNFCLRSWWVEAEIDIVIMFVFMQVTSMVSTAMIPAFTSSFLVPQLLVNSFVLLICGNIMAAFHSFSCYHSEGWLCSSCVCCLHEHFYPLCLLLLLSEILAVHHAKSRHLCLLLSLFSVFIPLCFHVQPRV